MAGDMISDVFIPMLDDPESTGTADPVEDYLAGLSILEGVADDVEIVVPSDVYFGRKVVITGAAAVLEVMDV